MTNAILSKKINPLNVKELLEQTRNYQPEESPKKIRIWDDPGEIQRHLNKMKRARTNEIYNDEYFKKFHGL